MKPPVLIILVMMCLMISTAYSSTRAQGHHIRERLEDGTPKAMLNKVAVRPISLVGNALGGAIYIVYWPFARMTEADNTPAKHILIDKPYKATFNRPLSDFSQLREMDWEN